MFASNRLENMNTKQLFLKIFKHFSKEYSGDLKSRYEKTNQNGNFLVFTTWNRPSKSPNFRSLLYFQISDIHLVLNESVFVRENCSRDLNNGQVWYLSDLKLSDSQMVIWRADIFVCYLNKTYFVYSLNGTRQVTRWTKLSIIWVVPTIWSKD